MPSTGIWLFRKEMGLRGNKLIPQLHIPSRLDKEVHPHQVSTELFHQGFWQVLVNLSRFKVHIRRVAANDMFHQLELQTARIT